jgi:hypothetical protein
MNYSMNWHNGNRVFKFQFNGRKRDAIGIMHEIEDSVEIESDSLSRAVAKLYDKYDHITQLRVQTLIPQWVAVDVKLTKEDFQ